MNKGSLEFEKHMAAKAAKELCYKKEVIDKIKNAKSEREIECILSRARKSY